MNDKTIKSMIYYDTEDKRDNYKYKEVSATNPLDVKYEDGMYTFNFIRFYNANINGKEYYIIVDRDDKNYSFGMSETLRNIVNRVSLGESFNGYEKEIIEHYIEKNGEDYTFWITGRNTLTLDYNKNKVPAGIVYATTPDLDISDDDIIEAKIEWYIEYKNYGDDNWHIKPTFCGDKVFREDPNIEKYRFVKAAVYEIDGTTYYDVVRRDETIHENNHEATNRDEVSEAVDAAKALIYGKDENTEMFAGYTRIYPFNTEDSSSIFKLQEDKISNQDVLTVTGSGDAILDLFMHGANTVTCFDINGMAKYYALLKYSFVKAGMTYQKFKDFFLGEGKSILDKTIYDKYSHFLDKDLKRFWDGVYEYLNTTNKKLLNNEHNLFYKIYDFFGNANQSYRNNCSYFGSEENYTTLQEQLKDKKLSDVSFVDCSLFDLPKKLAGKKYGYAYLSNILDFTELYFDMDDELVRKNAFKEFVRNELTEIIEENGTIDVGFISKEWQMGTTYTNTTKAFDEKEGFIIRDLYPYNMEDKVIVFKNRNLSLTEGIVLK